ncbi:molybdenum cofactor guanylyltransferase [Paenibacillus sp. F6_3S_P_1C]|uniref:Probable molybdenum cofactor guanylyltransferase n=1 Tax=Paenibacillus vandeheii TaxID=3035917 RepID=A0ABT8JEX2_9BACL|nr:molybdenum cofactor guanylyltransferase [Paenibacillus vandeheii]MDN4603627.1 molybdenum cofactor guanylyltransferase [Paenibacillus vandeheii]
MSTIEWTGIILAGGLSRRMGSNKAWLDWKGSSVLEQVIQAMTPAVNRIIISAGNNTAAYNALPYDCVHDAYPGKGPLAGLHAALKSSETDWNLVCACDMPLLQATFFNGMKRLTESGQEHQAIVPRLAGRVHPLAGAYHRRVLPELEQRLRDGRLRVTEWLEEIGCRYVEVDELESAGVHDVAIQLSNMNTPEDYEFIRNR